MKATYDTIGNAYNQTRKADPFLTKKLLEHLKPQPNGLYLDIGCGTGNYTSKLQGQGFDFIGIDPSVRMLEKAKTQHTAVTWQLGTAEKTGLPENYINGVIGSLTIHHWQDLTLAFTELHRVLKPDGNLVIFTSTPEQMKGYWLNHYFPTMLADSIAQMPSFESVKQAVQKAGLQVVGTEVYEVKPDLQDQFLYCGKEYPEYYFDPQIRNGISSFSALAHIDEVRQGLAALRKDIDNGRVQNIIDTYKNDVGDYLYILAKK